MIDGDSVVVLLFCVSCLAFRREKKQFEQFKSLYSKQYASIEEENKRFAIFSANMKRYDQKTRASSSAKFGMNPFADQTIEEFRGEKVPKKLGAEGLAKSCLSKGVTIDHEQYKSLSRAIPTSWDWRTKGVVSPVKDQAQCGSCWAFSTIGNIESQYALSGKKLTQFSEQLLVDCSHGCSNEPPYGVVCNQGCDGGWQWNSFTDIMYWGGVELETDYPYTGVDGNCALNTKKLTAAVKNYTCLTNNKTNNVDETVMAAYLYANGPIAIALNADYVEGYTSGIIDPPTPADCQGTSLDHAVLIVGYGVDSTSSLPFWIVKNSWSASWGEKGYFRIVRGQGACGLNTAVLNSILA